MKGWIAIAVAAVVYLGGVRNEPFYSWREAREALVVRAEIETGEWILPLRNGTEIPTKPPLYYWLAGATALVRGEVDPFSLRLPSALLAIAAVIAVFVRGGVAAALVLATSLEWIRSGTAARVDMTQAALLTAALLAFESATRAARPRFASLAVLYVGMGLATLAKGPTGILLPLLVGAVDLVLRRDADVLRLRPLAGLAIAAAIPGAWYLLAAGSGGEAFLRQHFLSENLGRFFAPESFRLPHVHAWYYYVPALAGGLAPWTPFLVPLAGELWRERERLEARRRLFPLVWLAVVFVFFSLAKGKRPVYLLSLYPAAALLIGGWWDDVAEGRVSLAPAFALLLRAVAWIFAVAVAAFLAALLAERSGIPLLETIGGFLGERDRAEIRLLADVVARSFPALLLWSLAAVLAAWLLVEVVRRAAWGEVVVALALVAAAISALASSIYFPAVAWRRTYAPFVAAVERALAPEDRLFFHRSFDHGAVFYARRRVERLRGDPCRTLSARHASYLLVTEREWTKLNPAKRARLRAIGRSDGAGPRGRDPLILARVRGDACG